MTDRQMLTTKDAAAFLGVSPKSFAANWYRWGLTAYRVGKRNMYRANELEKFLTDNAATGPRVA